VITHGAEQVDQVREGSDSMTKQWLIALGTLALGAPAAADFEKLGACSGLYEAGGEMARWRAVQSVAQEMGQQQNTTEAAYDAGWWFGVARGDWKALYLSFVSDYGEEQAESWRQSAISDNGCESIGDSPAE